MVDLQDHPADVNFDMGQPIELSDAYVVRRHYFLIHNIYQFIFNSYFILNINPNQITHLPKFFKCKIVNSIYKALCSLVNVSVSSPLILHRTYLVHHYELHFVQN